MDFLSASNLTILADATAASNDLRSYIMPLFYALCGLAGAVCIFFLVLSSYYLMTSSGDPEKRDKGKTILRNALIGFGVVLLAAALTSFLNGAYAGQHTGPGQSLPPLAEVKQKEDSMDPADLVIKAINGLLLGIIQSIGAPVVDALSKFTSATPLMAETSAVFNIWLVMVGIANVLFILVITLIGFHIMSAEALGLEEIDFRHLLPQIGLVFLLVNMSIFAIDLVIGLSNALIHALQAGVSTNNVWDVLKSVINETSGMGIAALFIMVAFLVLSIMLLVYYVMRMVILFLGAVLSPVVVLLWLLPSFRDFANTLIRSYLTTIFVLFVHTVILVLAATLFTGMKDAGGGKADPLMSMILGLATLVLLLRTQGMMTQIAFMSSGAKGTRKLGKQLVSSVSHLGNKMATAQKTHAANTIANARVQYVVNTMGAKK